MKKIFIVTGATGFLGNNVIRKIMEKYEDTDYEIRALAHSGSHKEEALEGLNCKIYQGNIADINSLKEIFEVSKSCNVIVIHCAAVVSIKAKKDPIIYSVNVEGTKNIVEKTLETKAKLVYVNSVHAIPEKPNNEKITEISEFDPKKVKGAYAKTKAEAANFVLDAVKTRDLDACIVHPSGMIGPNDFGKTHLTKLIEDLANGDFRVMVEGGYDFVDVRDVADAIVSAIEKGKKGNCYILSNKYCSVRNTADIACGFVGLKKIKFKIPMWVCKFFAPVCELYYNMRKIPPLFTKLSLYTITSNGNFNNSKAKNELGFDPRSIKKSIEDTILWLKDKGRVKEKFDAKLVTANSKQKRLQV